MRMLPLVLAAGCGRIGFDAVAQDATDATDATDAALLLGPCAGTLLFTDEFDDDTAAPLFAVAAVGAGLTLTESGGQLHADFAASVMQRDYAGYRTIATYPVESLCMVADLREVPIAPAVAYAKFFRDPDAVQFGILGDTLLLQTQINAVGGGGEVAYNQQVGFDLTTRYLRLRYAAGVVSWDTSADGVGFTNRKSLAFSVGSPVFIEIGGGTDVQVDNAGRASFESVAAWGL